MHNLCISKIAKIEELKADYRKMFGKEISEFVICQLCSGYANRRKFEEIFFVKCLKSHKFCLSHYKELYT